MTTQEELASNFRLTNYLYLAALAVLYYDHLITFGREVNLIWRRSFKTSSYLFFLNRYLLPLGNIIVAFSLFNTSLSPSVCKQLSLYHEILLGIAQFIVCVNLSLRIYAIYFRSRRVLISLSCILVVLAAVVLVTNFFQRQVDPSNVEGCHMANVDLLGAARTAAFWEVIFVYDIIIFAMLLRKAHQVKKETVRWTHHSVRPPSLLQILIRDGTIYFIIMAVANLTNIFFLYFSDLRSALSGLASSMSITMMSRLILNLHKTAEEGIYSTISYTPSFHAVTPRSRSTRGEEDDYETI